MEGLQNNLTSSYITTETTDLHNKTAALYEALMDREAEETILLIDQMREKLLTLKKDVLKYEI